MQKIDIIELKSKIDTDLSARKISGRTLLDKFCVVDNDSRKTAPYLDYRYAVFYYYLGKYIKPNFVFEAGFDLGLLSCCFLTSCKTVKHFLGYKEIGPDYVPIRLGKRNIRLVFKGETDFFIGRLHDQEFDNIFSPNLWDLTILNCEVNFDRHLEYLDFVWPKVSENGLIIAEYINRHAPAREAFLAFCESKNRIPVLFETRYGTGLLQK